MAHVKHPNGAVLRVSDESIDKYTRNGWTKVDEAKKRAPKKAAQPSEPSKTEE